METPIEARPPEPGEMAFAVTYETFFRADRHPRLKGKGRLLVKGGGKVFVFEGKRRGLFRGEPVSESMPLEEISNVTVRGRCIRFSEDAKDRQLGLQTFLFYCVTKEEATRIAGLFPQRNDAVYLEHQAFLEEVENLGEVSDPKRSCTAVIIGLNIAIYVVCATWFKTGWITTESMDFYVRYGANNGAATTDGEWWRLLTSMFLHFGVFHLGMNMWSLFNVGLTLEKLQGRALFLLTYLASGLGGGFMSLYYHGDKAWSAGASGAIFGVFGAYIGFALREHSRIPKSVLYPLLKTAGLMTAYNLFYGQMTAQIDNACHIGGLLTGLAFGWLCAIPVSANDRAKRRPQRVLQGLAVLASLIALGIWKAPRFSYSIREQLVWEDVLTRHTPAVANLDEELERQLARWTDPATASPETAQFISEKLIPAYSNFQHTLAELRLNPGMETRRNRDALEHYLTASVAALRHLEKAAREGDANEARAYREAASRAEAAVKKEMPEKKP